MDSQYSNVHGDLVIVDEARKMAAYSYTGDIRKTDRYKFGEVFSRNTKYFLFLTAMPLTKATLKNYRLLSDLLEPGFLLQLIWLKNL